MLKTAFTDLVGCPIPIQQAGMGTLAHPRLAAAVSNAGALGMVSVAGAPADLLTEVLDRVRQETTAPFGCNFLMPFVGEDVRECVAIAASRARLIDFFWGEPDRSLVDIVHEEGALACWQVGSRDEAVAAAKAGCDLIVAQGIEAGGHVRGRVSLLALLNEVLEAVDVPIIAAGGVGNGRAMAAALAAGADAVRVGTRFVSAVEAEAHELYVSALIRAEAADTVYTEAFSVGWPDAPHRVLRTSLQAAEAVQDDIIGERVGRYTGKKFPVHRLEIGVPTITTTGAIEAMPHWAGESVGGVRRVQPAADIVREMSAEAEELLKRWC